MDLEIGDKVFKVTEISEIYLDISKIKKTVTSFNIEDVAPLTGNIVLTVVDASFLYDTF